MAVAVAVLAVAVAVLAVAVAVLAVAMVVPAAVPNRWNPLRLCRSAASTRPQPNLPE